MLIDNNNIKILFSCFYKDEKNTNEEKARKAGMTVRTTVSKDLTYLCVGDVRPPPPSKVKKAKELGIPIIKLEEFKKIL
jgi:NAD-dependent DNA ligase